MTDRPIIFSGPMVRALLAGTKTMTRRVLKKQDWPEGIVRQHPHQTAGVPYAVGDRLWVREAFARVGDAEDDIHACPDLRIWAYYRADVVDPERQKWCSPIYMPRALSRLTLTVSEVRVERLQDISEADARAEGYCPITARRPSSPSSALATR